MVLLESSFLVDILRNKKSAISLLEEFERRKEPTIVVASPSIVELWEGALKSKLSEKEKLRVDDLLSSASVLLLDVKSAKRTAEIVVESSKKGLAIEPHDAMIAGIASANDEIIVTRDNQFARLPGLKVLTY